MVFLKAPQPHDKILTYELYESKDVDNVKDFKPRLLAVSQIPINYVKDQLKTFRNELFEAKYVNKNVIPGTRIRTLREWQIDNVLKTPKQKSLPFNDKMSFKSYML